ncbi:Piwi domain-containing protein [Chlamydoabsidia padenii]|nr:Piwi domain-containing protein [Chlamydoabsidia padenii]
MAIPGQQLTPLVLRPNTGKAGTPTRVRANFLTVTTLPTQNIQHLDIQIIPTAPPAVNRKIWQFFESSPGGQQFLNKTKVIYDGRANLFSPKPLKLGQNDAASFEVDFTEGKRSGGVFKLNIKIVGSINMTELDNFLKGKSSITNNCLTAIMVLDILIGHAPSLLYPTVGRSFFTPQGSFPLSNGAVAWQGYYQSARPTPGKMMINVDISATAFYEAGPLPELVAKILNRRSVDDLRRGVSERDIKRVSSVLKSIKIKVIHRGAEKQFKYKIARLTPGPADQTMFAKEDGTKMSVASYFQNQYGSRLAYPFLPCVVVKRDTFLPMEVCEVIPGQRMLKKLNDKQTAEMIKFTCHKPHARSNKINQGINLLKYRENEHIQEFGMKIDPEMAQVDARVLPAPRVSYHQTSQDANFLPGNGAWTLRGKKLASGATVKSWSVVNFDIKLNNPMIQRFMRELIQKFVEAGMNVLDRQPLIETADPQGNIEKTLKEVFIKTGKKANSQPQMIICILPALGSPLYAEIKRISDTILGIHTQVLQSKHIGEAKKQYCANVCLKVNTKLGGKNHLLDRNQIPFISKKPTIVFGADVSHPAPGDNNHPSVVALTASMDASVSQFASAIRVQASRTEIINDLANMVKELLKAFFASTGAKPAQILFYRDGVSEGQFAKVLEQEVAAIHAACASLEKGYRPPLTFLVVQKRHHARFFPMRSQDSDKSGNCLPGTVIDTGIVHPFEFDFYLQSHAGLLGTSRPAHYHVLYDDNKFKADELQELTYRLCYTYGRCTSAVSLCPPAYYAHLLAARARCHQKSENWADSTATSESLDTQSQMNNYATVVPALQKTMYFM